MTDTPSRPGPLSLPTRIFRAIVHAFTLRGFSLRTRVAGACVVVAVLVIVTGAVIGGGLGVAVSSAVRNAFAAEPLLESPVPPK